MDRESFNIAGHAHFLTFSCFHKRQLLTDDRVRHWLAQSINECRDVEQIALWAYVFMPDHVHLLICPKSDDYSMAKILRRIKEPVTHRLVRHWTENAPGKLESIKAGQGQRIVHRMWQAGGGYDRNLTSWESIAKAIDYIEWNPVRRKYVDQPEDWMWSSANARVGKEQVPLAVDPVETEFAVN